MNVYNVLIDSRYRSVKIRDYYSNDIISKDLYPLPTEFNIPYTTVNMQLPGVPIKHTTYFIELLDLALPVNDALDVPITSYLGSPYLLCEFYSANSKIYRTRFATNNILPKVSNSSFVVPVDILSPSALAATGQSFVHLSSPQGHYVNIQFDEELCFRVADHKGNTLSWTAVNVGDADLQDKAQVSALFKFTLPTST